MRSVFNLILLPLLICMLTQAAYAQCEGPAKKGNTVMTPFLSNGQYLHKYMQEGQVVSLKATLFEGFKYRVVSTTDSRDGGRVLYRMLDGGRNTLFSNKNQTSEYWDFEVGATDNFLFQAKLTKGTGCLVLLIGFDDSALNKGDEFDDMDDLDDVDNLLDDLDDNLDDDLNLDLDDDLDDDPLFDEDEDDY